MNTNRFFVRLNSVVAILALMFYLSGIAMAQSPQGQKPADKTPPPEGDTFGDDGTPTFEDVPTPTFQPRPLVPAKQDDKEKGQKEKKEKKDKGDGVVQIQSALPDLKFGSVVVTPDGDVAGGSGVTGQAATITVTIINGGSGTAGEFRLDVWKHLPSPPNFGSIGDFSQTFSGLAGNTSLTVSYSFTMANSYGTYFPRSTVDSGSLVVETSEANNTNTGSYTVIEMATVVPPTINTVSGATVVFRGVAKPYGKKWPVGQPTALITVPGVGTVTVPNTGTAELAGVGVFGPIIKNLIGDASLTCALAAGFGGTATVTFICGTSTASGELRSVCLGPVTPSGTIIAAGASITFTVPTNPAGSAWNSGAPTATVTPSDAGTLGSVGTTTGSATVTYYSNSTLTGAAAITFNYGSCSSSTIVTRVRVEVEINNTTDEGDDIVCRKSTSPAERPTVACRARVIGLPSGTISVVLVNKNGDGDVRFPAMSDTTKTLTLPSDQSWVSFEISGEVESATMRDAIVEVRLEGQGGRILAQKNVTVLWVDLDSESADGSKLTPNEPAGRNTAYPLYVAFTQDGLFTPLGDRLGIFFVARAATPDVPARMHAGIEIRGTVFPRDFDRELRIERYGIDDRFFEDLLRGDQQLAPGADDTSALTVDNLPFQHDGKNVIFDEDAPSLTNRVATGTARRAALTRFRQRVTFRLDAASPRVRCSDDLLWYMDMYGVSIDGQWVRDPAFTSKVAKGEGAAIPAENLQLNCSVTQITVVPGGGNTSTNAGPVNVEILGGNFADLAQVTLIRGATQIVGTLVRTTASNRITARFDLTGQPAGVYRLSVTAGGATGSLDNAFFITEP